MGLYFADIYEKCVKYKPIFRQGRDSFLMSFKDTIKISFQDSHIILKIFFLLMLS